MAGTALDKLKKAASMAPVKKTVTLSDGSEFEFWHTPLTVAERERAAKQAGSNEPNALAMQLLLLKLLDESGERMFKAGNLAELKNDVRSLDLDRIVIELVKDESLEGVEPGK